ncbi:MAG TPA: hypothetical protein PLU49_12565 [Saprospiraceae bacterium]|nr:hypothetical protein [Saprospirales bacterium]HRQ30906.1 hypothetical protein [Saprospiraceae bacterium]
MKHGKLMLFMLILLTLGLNSCRKDADNFVGSYNARDSWVLQGQSSYHDYSFTITASATDDSKVLLNGLGDMQGVAVEAIVSDKNLTIPQQTVFYDGANISLSGSGSITGVDLTISYSFQLSTIVLNVNCSATRL